MRSYIVAGHVRDGSGPATGAAQLKQIVAEAESLAKTMEHELRAVAAQVAVRVEDVRERAAAIDWS